MRSAAFSGFDSACTARQRASMSRMRSTAPAPRPGASAASGRSANTPARRDHPARRRAPRSAPPRSRSVRGDPARPPASALARPASMRNDDVEMLILGEVATHQPARARRRFPVDQVLADRRRDSPAAAALPHRRRRRRERTPPASGADALRLVAQDIGHDAKVKCAGSRLRPPRKPERTRDARTHHRPRMRAQAARRRSLRRCRLARLRVCAASGRASSISTPSGALGSDLDDRR